MRRGIFSLFRQAVIDDLSDFPFRRRVERCIDGDSEESSPHCEEDDQSEKLSEESSIAPYDDGAQDDHDREYLMELECIYGK